MDSTTTTAATVAATPVETAPRRLDNSLLDKSLDELIKTNRRANKNNKNTKKNAKKPAGKENQKKNPMTVKPAAVKKLSIAELRRSNKHPNNAQKNKPVAKSTSNLRQPWEKPAKLPVAPLPSQPLKISIRNELAESSTRSSSSSAMDWDRPARSYEARDRVEGRQEYRMGGRAATQPMNIDYDYRRY